MPAPGQGRRTFAGQRPGSRPGGHARDSGHGRDNAVQRLRTGGLVALLCERDLTGSGIEVEFLGEPARIMGGPAALAEQTGAALMPVTLWYEGENWGAHIHQEIPVPGTGTRQEKIAAMTQQLARVFENGIARHSERTGTCCRRCSSPISTPAGRAPLASNRRPPANSAAETPVAVENLDLVCAAVSRGQHRVPGRSVLPAGAASPAAARARPQLPPRAGRTPRPRARPSPASLPGSWSAARRGRVELQRVRRPDGRPGSGEEHEADVLEPAADLALARRVQGDAFDRSSDRLPMVSAAHQSRASQRRRWNCFTQPCG